MKSKSDIYLLIQSVVVQRSQILSFPYTNNLIVHRILKISEIQLSKLSSTTECYRSEHFTDYRTLIHIVSRKVFALRRNIVYNVALNKQSVSVRNTFSEHLFIDRHHELSSLTTLSSLCSLFTDRVHN